ncbi:MAG: HAD family phosphatase [Cyanobacteria bacterium P01_H01_bin.15]
MLEAILFDLDGTLVNSDPIHFTIWQELLANYGYDIDHTFYRRRISGRVNEDILQDLLPQLTPAEVAQFAWDKEATFRQRGTDLTRLAGLDSMLAWIQEQGLKAAVVTNAPKENAYFMMDALNLRNELPVLILAEEAPPGKPDPAPYLLALQQLDVNSRNAIAFEDSPSGIRAAVAANLFTYGVASGHTPERLRDFGAHDVIYNFTDTHLWTALTQRLS